MKYYAVASGHKRGIYESWESCKKQVIGYKNAKYKSFSKEEDARSFLNEDSKPNEKSVKDSKINKISENKNKEQATSKKPSSVYAVAIGHKRGIFDSWDKCQEQVKGFKGAKYKKFSNTEDAEKFLLDNPELLIGEKPISTSIKRDKNTADDNDKHYKLFPPSPISLTLSFDGGSRGNGFTSTPVAGCGTVLTIINSEEKKQEKINIRQFLKSSFNGTTNTNNFAEYTGLIIGLKKIQEMKVNLPGVKLDIFGDSKLVINQLLGEWECRATNIASLFLEAKVLLKDFRKVGMKISLNHVYRDKNKAADELANEAMETKTSWTTTQTKDL